MRTLLFLSCLFIQIQAFSQVHPFKQLGNELATPNTFRAADGAPGPSYWQQQADYKINVVLDEMNQTITGSETITYTNNAPNTLRYIWLQLDQNIRAKDSNSPKISTRNSKNTITQREHQSLNNDFDGGFKLTKVTTTDGRKLDYTVHKTMMRIELPKVMKTGDTFSFNIDWYYNINDRMKIGGRSGYEYFEEDDNYLFTIAQFFPRMCVYDDLVGWQNKQFLGRGEFALPFGNYEVSITVPADHLVAATGELQNESEVLSKKHIKRYNEAKKSFDKPVIIATQKEAIKREKSKSRSTKTWRYKADNVRDFAFASSRKFIWDAQATDINGKTVMSMSMYPKEGNPMWERYSTKAVDLALKVFSKYTIDYPYPVAWSINAKRIGMEYPMICFNYGRTDKNGHYEDRLKYRVISVIIHEIGHNFFPMIINSDERQWTWMDEGLNTFVQYLTELEWDPNYPSRRGPAKNIVHYMKGDKDFISPIMINSELIHQFGNNAYGKPATALYILRDAVMGPELFDYAFKEYARRWAFKHPRPADFFRTMEDASAFDLDWFWRGWFYTTDHVDISIDSVKVVRPDFKSTKQDKSHYTELSLSNIGGLVMPVILEITLADGSKENIHWPAEVWKKGFKTISKVIKTDKAIRSIVLDPKLQTADTDVENNYYPRKQIKDRFNRYKDKKK